MSMSVFANEAKDLTIEVNGSAFDTYDFEQNIDTPAVIVEGRTLIPLRKMFGVFDVEPIWNGNDRSIEATYNGVQIWLQIDNKVAIVNGVETELDVPAQIMNNRTYVPLRFITETFGVAPGWDGENRVVSLEVIVETEVEGEEDAEVFQLE